MCATSFPIYTSKFVQSLLTQLSERLNVGCIDLLSETVTAKTKVSEQCRNTTGNGHMSRDVARIVKVLGHLNEINPAENCCHGRIMSKSGNGL